MATETREFPRVDVVVPGLMSSPSGAETFDLVTTHQLGRGGCMVQSPQRLQPGRIFGLTLDLGGKYVYAISKVIYEVIRGEEILAGMKFIFITNEGLAALDEFIGRRLRFAGKGSP
jgi:hypothetical protein